MEMLNTLARAWKTAEIRKKIIFTLLMMLVFRIGSNIPVPGIDREILSQLFSEEMGLLSLFDLFDDRADAGTVQRIAFHIQADFPGEHHVQRGIARIKGNNNDILAGRQPGFF